MLTILLLALLTVSKDGDSIIRPIVFIASCFGGLVLAKVSMSMSISIFA